MPCRQLGNFVGSRLIPALAAALLLAAPPALADTKPAPTLTSVTEENGDVKLSWTYNESPDGFKWRGKQDGENWAEWGGGDEGSTVRAGGTARSQTVSGLDSGNTYTFEVQAVFLVLDQFNMVAREYLTAWSNAKSVTVPEEE